MSNNKYDARQVLPNIDFADTPDIKFAYQLIIEWDGKKPPTSFYNRMREYGLSVRGRGGKAKGLENDQTPLARRLFHTKKGWGVIAQEGIILVETENLLQQLTQWAQYYGARSVMTGRFLIEQTALEESDRGALEAFVKAWTKTGPKRAAELGIYVITCRDELKTFERELEATPLQCPDCLSTNFNARMGKQDVFMSAKYRADDMPLFDYWLATRFSTGMFELPIMVNSHKAGEIIPPSPKDVIRKLKLPEVRVDPILFKSDDDLLHIYDLSYVLSKMSRKDRINGRLRVLLAYNIANAEGGTVYSMAIKGDGSLDIVDLCVLDNQMTRYL